ncbi:MAG: 1-acyl-sn-glycerol-3-phosphate acyltransferase [Thiothrix nivea]|nr:MAG: 1-acyl-sn-glycerol-3-phosphate acyltransferase [Thiothrix nivea]
MGFLIKLWLGLRATLFMAGFVLTTLVYVFVFPLLIFSSYRQRYPVLAFWSTMNLWWLKVTCGVNYRVLGRENIPVDSTALIMSNHQSTWETMALAEEFPPLTWVLKRELLKVPVFGWGLRMIKPIAIDRRSGRSAVEQIKVQGKKRLDEGIWMVIFPEGTRVRPGVKVRYKLGGAVLAAYAGYPVIPVAHNAGMSWPRHSFIKKPGTITMSIGQPIATQGRTPEDILQEVERWIEAEKARLVF